jgi:hypothetical protein
MDGLFVVAPDAYLGDRGHQRVDVEVELVEAADLAQFRHALVGDPLDRAAERVVQAIAFDQGPELFRGLLSGRIGRPQGGDIYKK